MYSLSDLVAYFIIGKLTIFMLQNFPPVRMLGEKVGFLGELVSCDLCLGVWVFWFFALIFKVNFFYELGYVPILCELLTGAAASLLMYIFRIGWADRFGVYRS
jgi:hypothetical protein